MGKTQKHKTHHTKHKTQILSKHSKRIKHSKHSKHNKSITLDFLNEPDTQQPQPQPQHKYYIVKCYNKNDELIYDYLETHLQNLGVMPDTNAINVIKKMDTTLFKKLQIPLNTYCDTNPNIKLQHFNEQLVNADCFFLSNINRYINKRFYNNYKYVSNIANMNTMFNIINKYNLIKNITAINPIIAKTNLARTFNINEFNKYEFPKWYILRPIESFGGDNILYINSRASLNSAILFYKTHKNYMNKIIANDVIASEYITNPLLFHNKKFHLRLYLMITINIKGNVKITKNAPGFLPDKNYIFKSFLWDNGKILTARDNFNMNKPFTRETHDTHVKSTLDDYMYLDYFNNQNLQTSLDINAKYTKTEYKHLWDNITAVCNVIGKILEQNKKQLIYPNEQNIYHIFGLDVMIRNNLEVVLIEINKCPGSGFKHDKNRDSFSKSYFQWINDKFLEPLFNTKE